MVPNKVCLVNVSTSQEDALTLRKPFALLVGFSSMCDFEGSSEMSGCSSQDSVIVSQWEEEGFPSLLVSQHVCGDLSWSTLRHVLGRQPWMRKVTVHLKTNHSEAKK